MHKLPTYRVLSQESRAQKKAPVRRYGGAFIGFIRSLLFLAVVAGVLGAAYAFHRVTSPVAPQEKKLIWIPRGAGVPDIAQTLTQSGVIRSPQWFRLTARYYGLDRKLKAGEYAIPPGSSLKDIAQQLAEGKVYRRRITVPEGTTVAGVVATLNRMKTLTGAITRMPPEGRLMPNTYEYIRGDSREGVLKIMHQAMAEFLANEWPKREQGLPLKTPEEALILASIVEKETSVPDERARIAAVFVNRLRRGMMLQADPTVVYGITRGRRPLGRALTRKDLRQPTPYNTYRITGLPPTPIANPSPPAITAVLHPMRTRELYFVADGSGGHAFAATLDEHRKNVRRWKETLRKQRKARGNR